MLYNRPKINLYKSYHNLYIPLDTHSLWSPFHVLNEAREDKSQTFAYMLSAKQGSIWYHFYNVFGMT